MAELNASTLAHSPLKVAAPPYDRSRLMRDIAHFGVGNFRRAHQAFYIDRVSPCLARRTGASSASEGGPGRTRRESDAAGVLDATAS